MATLSKHHRELDAEGRGKCSVPMWMGGCPSGFCDAEAYGERPKCQELRDGYTGRPFRVDGKYDGYVPALACPAHGGPTSRVFRDGDAWCAVHPGFVNLQESPAGFGATPDEARADLSNAMIAEQNKQSK